MLFRSVRKVIDDLKEFGFVQRAFLGLEFKKQKGEDKDKEELYVARVVEGGGAAAAGIKEGDVLTGINNVSVRTFAEVQEQLSKYRPNDQVNVTIVRDKKAQQYAVTLRNIEGNTEILRGDASNNILGAKFEEVPSKDRQNLDIKSGVKVKDVGQGKLKSAGIRNGFIITAVNDKPVNSASDIQAIIGSVESKGRILINGVYPNGQVTYYVFAK